mmetsp:Transcript_24260/g.37412  ORF Transcript_24260/g.37412 Transcript_24260/m.37412 type:complete len:81 (+) Transcript_24260:1409-1651(+)
MKIQDQESNSSRERLNSDTYPEITNNQRRKADSLKDRNSNSNSMARNSKVFGYPQGSKFDQASSEDKHLASLKVSGSSDI